MLPKRPKRKIPCIFAARRFWATSGLGPLFPVSHAGAAAWWVSDNSFARFARRREAMLNTVTASWGSDRTNTGDGQARFRRSPLPQGIATPPDCRESINQVPLFEESSSPSYRNLVAVVDRFVDPSSTTLHPTQIRLFLALFATCFNCSPPSP